ncbi:uncharacterized protein LOC128212834 [Mya arenaria]|uniref:uncharacterized protein LOC128212834 n=1 Tax=Mya arenaria TaxID=6604 RepID=UPI0022E44411|nr:uncharacterized protein LOC128212834 [Mya arenaria]
MEIRSLYLVVYVLPALAVGQLLLPSGRTVDKVLLADCKYDSRDNSYSMTLSIRFNGDPVSRLQVLSSSTYNDANVVACAYEGTVAPDSSVLIKSKYSLSNANANENQCGGRTNVENGVPNGAIWSVLPRENIINTRTDMDIIYNVICRFPQSHGGNLVPAGGVISVFEDDQGTDSVRQRPESLLAVLARRQGSTAFSQQVSEVGVGDQVILRAQTKVKDVGFRLDNFDVAGSYVFSCSYTWSYNQASVQFIDADGCANNVFSDLVGGFGHSESDFLASVTPNFRWFSTKTNPFVLTNDDPPNHFYRLSCYVGYCHTLFDPKCIDFCAYNRQNGRRRRRQTFGEQYDQLFTVIQVYSNDTATVEPPVSPQPQKSLDTLVIAVSASVAGLVLFAALGIVLFLCCYRRGSHERWEAASDISSRQNLPRNLAYDHMKTPKF